MNHTYTDGLPESGVSLSCRLADSYHFHQPPSHSPWFLPIIRDATLISLSGLKTLQNKAKIIILGTFRPERQANILSTSLNSVCGLKSGMSVLFLIHELFH